jgi:hypothetical protein
VDLRGRGQPLILTLREGCDIGALLSERPYENIIPVRVWDNFEMGEVARNTPSLPFYLMTALNAVVESRTRNRRFNDDSESVRDAWRQYVNVMSHTTRGVRRDLDPESYAVELEQSMRAATDSHTVWYEYVNTAPEFLASGMRVRDQNPLFVFAFEDMHLAPQSEHELRRALRQLSHPRLCYVFSRTGEYRVDHGCCPIEAPVQVATPAKPVVPHLSTFGRALLGEDEF